MLVAVVEINDVTQKSPVWLLTFPPSRKYLPASQVDGTSDRYSTSSSLYAYSVKVSLWSVPV